MNQLQTRQVPLPPSLRSLTLSTNLGRMKGYDDRASPTVASPPSSAYTMPSPGSPRTPNAASDEVGFTSLPPPPRRTRPRRVPVPEYLAENEVGELSKLTVKTTHRVSKMSLDEVVVAESPTMAWLQREEVSESNRGPRRPIFGQVQPITIAEEEEPKHKKDAIIATTTKTEDDGEKRVSAAVAEAKAVSEDAATAATDSSSSKLDVKASHANPQRESVRLESSFEDIRVAEIQYFRTSKPRIIRAVISPTSPHNEENGSPTSRMPVEVRDTPPPTPLRTGGSTATIKNAKTLKSDTVATSTAQFNHQHTCSPSSPPNFSSATLPLRIDKRSQNTSFHAGRSTASLPPPTSPSGAPLSNKFIGPKGSTTNPSKEYSKRRTRSKLVKSKNATSVDMHQLQAFIASRDGTGRSIPSMPAQPWRPRPLISHAKSASRSSGCSMDSATTYNPPSTVEIRDGPRVSISSTIYTSSNDHPGSVPDTANHPHFPPRSPGIESFIGSSSEEGEFNPSAYQRNDILHEIQSEQVIDSDNYQLMSILSGTNVLNARSRSPKPPVPRTPKPIFSRKTLEESFSPSSSPNSTSLVFEGYQSADGWDPSAGNWLAHEERADLIRKSRKLARVFGRTPGADIMACQESRSASQSRASKAVRHARTPLSISNDIDDAVTVRHRRASAWPSPTESHFSTSSSSRRHSAPLSPDDISFLNVSSPLYEASLSQVASQFRCESSAAATSSGFCSQVEESSNDRASVTHQESSPNQTTRNRASSPSKTSFIDWSDEEGPDDGLSIISQEPPSKVRRPTSPTHSFFENLTPEEQAEEDKRRKREKLAKLHRFLGSRVPVNLVVGPDFENDMPSESPRPTTAHSTGSAGGKVGSDAEELNRKAWMRRRRSSSAAALPSWSDDMDRLKEELDTKEKLLNVRRAQKMEKVFGVAPPQTLYHTRGHTPSPSLPSLAPIAPKTIGNPSAFIPSLDAIYMTPNPNRSSYNKSESGKLSRRRTGRPSTAESAKHLIPKGRRSSSTTSFSVAKHGSADDSGFSYNQSLDRSPTSGISYSQPQSSAWTSSAVYAHYQHSLNSLNDILDRDDRESLLELHNYLNPEQADQDADDRPPIRERRLSDTSILTERRRSFPIGGSASETSLVSEHTIALERATTPTKGYDLTDFQQRRRRAAKLTQFFGVQYRELINDVLDSLENGLEHEQKRGTLQADEIADLLNRLRELKVKREGIAA